MRGVHGEKLIAVLASDKLPPGDIARVKAAIANYDAWVEKLNGSVYTSVSDCVRGMTGLLTEYKNTIDLELIFDSRNDFLYRQKGQLKLDNTVLEEFLPILVKKCFSLEFASTDVSIGSQIPTYSSAYFISGLGSPVIGGGLTVKTKAQDFSMSRKVFIQASYSNQFPADSTVTIETHLGYALAELKTNLDKTMFQEASATAHDVKLAVSGAKYYLLCDFLDMTPISTTTTDIDEILILRKAKRVNANVRNEFSTYEGRLRHRDWFLRYLEENPYSVEVLARFVGHLLAQMRNESLTESNVLEIGYF